MPTQKASRADVPEPKRRPRPDRAPAAVAHRDPGALFSVRGTSIDSRSLLFDPDWYRETYPDVALAGLDPIRHFFENGAREGRNPNPFFDTHAYVRMHPDVAATSMNPFMHYLLYGAREGRPPR